MSIYQPYTYLIGWSHLNKFYYGVRYAQGCHPGDLWTEYWTSSEYVKAFRKEHGEPDIIEIRRTFKSAEPARKWEGKVLRRMKVVKDERFHNKHDSMSPPNQSIESMAGTNVHLKGEKRTPAQVKASKKHSLLMTNKISPKRMSITILGKQFDSKNLALRYWGIGLSMLNKVVDNPHLSIGELRILGMVEKSRKLKGRTHSSETKMKISKSHIGLKPSDETRLKMSKSQRERFTSGA